jgi:predicted PurR-regulated permease PerM
MSDGNTTEAGAGSGPSGWRVGDIGIPPEAARSMARTMRSAVLVALALVLLWLSIDVLLIIFAGILLAIFMRGLADALRHYAGKLGIHLSIGWSLLLVIIGILVALAAIGWFFDAQISSQIDQLTQQLPKAFHNFEDKLRQFSWGRALVHAINPAQVASAARAASSTVASTVFGAAYVTVEVIAGVIIFLFIGLYCAAEPGPYVRGAVSLVAPAKRERAHHILQETARSLWYWEMGRLFSKTSIGVVTGIGLWVLGVPVPGALGLLAGILTFVPYVGTVVSAIPAVLLALTIDPRLALYTILLYVGAHTLEGYILVPLVQKRAAHLAPALTLSAQAILSAIIGLAGLALATPLAAAGVVLTRLIYVEGVLGDEPAHSTREAPDQGQ